MSSQEVIEVKVREKLGTRHARQLREAGQIPVVLYGHGEQTVSLQVAADQVDAVIRHGAHVVEMKGAESGSALIREVQWGPLGSQVLHLDLTRVDAGELVELTVPVELRGDAPGTREGGVLQHLLHEIELRCPVSAVPEKIEVNVNSLELEQQVTVADLELGAKVEALADPETVVVQCVEATVTEEEAVAAEGAEPELIGRKEDEEGSED